MVTPACVSDEPFLLVLVALNYLFACWLSNSGPSGPVSKPAPPSRELKS